MTKRRGLPSDITVDTISLDIDLFETVHIDHQVPVSRHVHTSCRPRER